MTELRTQTDLINFVQNELSNGNLSIRGVAKLCGVSKDSIIYSGDFKSQKLAETMTANGFEGGDLIKNGFPPKAVWLCIEYFAYESKAKAEIAKQIARTFGMIGIITTFEQLTPKPTERQLPPVRDAIDYVQACIDVEKIENPILKAGVSQLLAEAIGVKSLPAHSRLVSVAVKANELGFNATKTSITSRLGKFVKERLEPQGKVPLGSYMVYSYVDNQELTDVITEFYSNLS